MNRFSRWRKGLNPGLAIAATVVLSGCAIMGPPPGGKGQGDSASGTMRPYEVNGIWYHPHVDNSYQEVGLATWYGPQAPDQRTADGEHFDVNALSAAHRTLPLPSMVEVANLENGRRIVVRVNDRGPFVAGRIIDLSPRAARELGIIGRGSARVRVRYIGPASRDIEVSSAATVSDGPVAQKNPGGVPLRKVYRIRAGAFADRANADKAISLLSQRGSTHLRPFASSGILLYRVELDCPPDSDPETVRQNVVSLGFPGAIVVGPF